MSCSLRNVDACLPITALQTLNSPGISIIFNGQGPNVRLIDDDSGLLLANLRVFERNNVHGILIKKQTLEGDGLRAEILIWGGQSFRQANVTVCKTSTSVEASLSTTSPEYAGPDWILDGDFYSDNSSLENPKACLITAHNALLILDFKQGSCQRDCGTIEWRELGTGLRSILYSADVAWISPHQILVAAGTVFGEIIVWSCYLESGSCRLSTKNSLVIHYYFTGHEGSIFGVNISSEISISTENNPRRFLASCSDDRTIRIWDISDCPRSVNECSVRHATDGYGLHATGFGDAPSDESNMKSKACIAKTWGHASRIWGVYFLEPLCPRDCTSLSLISRGEDATCQIWSMNFRPNDTPMQQAKLKNISSHGYHSGKNMWSLTLYRDTDHFKIYTGGADGTLVSLCIPGDATRGSTYRTLRDRRDMDSISSHNIDPNDASESSLVSTQTKKQAKKDISVLKGYGFISDDCFLTVSGQGIAWLGHVRYETAKSKRLDKAEGDTRVMSPVFFERIPTLDPIVGCPIIATLPNKGIAVLCDANRGLHWYDKNKKALYLAETMGGDISTLHIVDPDPTGSNGPALNSSSSIAILVSYFNIPEVDLVLNQSSDLEHPVMRQIRLILPETFKLTGFLYIEERNCVILGSRSGAFVVYRLDNALHDEPPISSVYRHVHGEESVTSIIRVPQSNGDETNQEIILSCGRDGRYCVHVLAFGSDINSPVRLQTVHQSSPPFGPNIEEARFDESTNDLILYGFRHKSFVVWNESSRTEIMSVECGGSHRAWAYTPLLDAHGSGTYVWTQASTFNIFSMESPSHRVIRAGSHGREIKTFSISNPVTGVRGRECRLLATGAEDTTIRIFTIDSSTLNDQPGSFKCLRTLNKHKGGIQNLRWSRNGKFLFSSSGCEEFYVWKVQSVLGFGIGLVFEAPCPKSKEVSDLRTISFDLLEVDGPEGTDCFLLCLAYSNSTVKVFHYSSSHLTGEFTLLASGRYTTNCPTQIQFVKSSHHVQMITCATDGHFATWDLTAAMEPFYHLSESHIIPKQRLLGTETIPPVEIGWKHHHQIHQSSIKSMEIVYQSEVEALLIAGGDDNALSISRIHLSPSSSPTNSRCSTLLLPKAHASAITTITSIPQRSPIGAQPSSSKSEFIIASSGNDQRLKLWAVCVDLEKPGVDGIGISLKADKFSAVADISCIDTFNDGDGDPGKEQLLICGVGMDLWDLHGE